MRLWIASWLMCGIMMACVNDAGGMILWPNSKLSARALAFAYTTLLIWPISLLSFVMLYFGSVRWLRLLIRIGAVSKEQAKEFLPEIDE